MTFALSQIWATPFKIQILNQIQNIFKIIFFHRITRPSFGFILQQIIKTREIKWNYSIFKPNQKNTKLCFWNLVREFWEMTQDNILIVVQTLIGLQYQPPLLIPRISAFSICISLLLLHISIVMQKESVDNLGQIEIYILKYYVFKKKRKSIFNPLTYIVGAS